MFRRTFRRLCEQDAVSGDKGHMTYAQACAIFGFQLNERLEKKEIKKRFQKLVLKFHPDHGGTSEQFQLLKEAQKIMETHRHDKGAEHADGTRFKFHKVTYDDATNTIHRQTADNIENRSFGMMDFAFFVGIFGFMTSAYWYHAWKTQEHLTRSRWRMTEDKMKPVNPETENAWHPWKADQDIRDQTYEIGVIQGSIKRELLQRRQEEVPHVPHPLVPRSPWVSGPRPKEALNTAE